MKNKYEVTVAWNGDAAHYASDNGIEKTILLIKNGKVI